MARALMLIGGLLLIVVAAGLLYLSFADLGRYRPEVEAAVSSVIGRDFRIAGEFRLKITDGVGVRGGRLDSRGIDAYRHRSWPDLRHAIWATLSRCGNRRGPVGRD